MARWIEAGDLETLPPHLTLHVRDAVALPATGARLLSGEAVQLLGPFVQELVIQNGGVVTPAGPPNLVVILALQRGRAVVEIMDGDPFYGVRSRKSLELTVEE